MNDEEYEKFLKDACSGRWKPGQECPPDDMLLDYVYNELKGLTGLRAPHKLRF